MPDLRDNTPAPDAPASKLAMKSPADAEKGSSLWRDAWIRLKKNKVATASLWIFIAIVFLCTLGPAILPLNDPNATHPELKSQSAFSTSTTREGAKIFYLFGSDNLGRDIFSRILHGGRVSLAVGFIATAVSLTIGVIYGAVAGFAGGRLDSFMMRIVDILYALPFVIIVIILTTVFADIHPFENTPWLGELSIFQDNMWLLFLAIGAVEWLTMSRIVRGQVLSLKKQEFIDAAISLGHSRSRIILRHLIPNTLGPVIVYATLTVPAVMRLEAILSFIGLGVQPPNASWGSLIKEGSDRMISDPSLLLYPSLAFALTLFCLNFLGDGLRDALDPKTSKD